MKKVIAVLALVAFANVAHAEWYNDGNYPVRDAARAVVHGVGNAVGQAAQAAATAFTNSLTECSMDYRRDSAQVLVVGAGVGSGRLTCKNGWGGEQTTNLRMISIFVGPGVGFFREEGTMRFAGFGTSVEFVAAALAEIQGIYAFHNDGSAGSLVIGAGVGAGPNGLPGATAMVGYSTARVRGAGVALRAGLTLAVHDSAAPAQPQQPQQQQQQQAPAQQQQQQQAPRQQQRQQQQAPAQQQQQQQQAPVQQQQQQQQQAPRN